MRRVRCLQEETRDKQQFNYLRYNWTLVKRDQAWQTFSSWGQTANAFSFGGHKTRSQLLSYVTNRHRQLVNECAWRCPSHRDAYLPKKEKKKNHRGFGLLPLGWMCGLLLETGGALARKWSPREPQTQSIHTLSPGFSPGCSEKIPGKSWESISHEIKLTIQVIL